MVTFKYSDSVQVLLEKFPEFKDSNEYLIVQDELDLPYGIYFAFMKTILQEIKSPAKDTQIIKRFVDFVNESFADDETDPESLNLMQIEFFENLTSSKDLIEFARKNFIGKALEMFEFTSKHFGVEAAESRSK